MYLFYIYQICNIYFFNIRANEICKSKGKSKITVKDVMEAIEKAGLNNFKSEIDDLLLDIERLNSKVDEYYLKYGELPKLCNYTSETNLELNSREALQTKIKNSANSNGASLQNELNQNDSDEYYVIDLEKLGNLSLNYGYDEEYKSIKNRGVTEDDDIMENNSNNEIETEIYIINAKTHQIYFPHGIFSDNVMYITF